MHRPFLFALLSCAILSLTAAAAPGAPPDPCAVRPSARVSPVPGIYTVTLAVRAPCAGVQVRLESYVGGTFPRDGWFTVTPTTPLTREGVPWYWRARVRNKSGNASHPLVIPGMVKPFSRPQ